MQAALQSVQRSDELSGSMLPADIKTVRSYRSLKQIAFLSFDNSTSHTSATQCEESFELIMHLVNCNTLHEK